MEFFAKWQTRCQKVPRMTSKKSGKINSINLPESNQAPTSHGLKRLVIQFVVNSVDLEDKREEIFRRSAIDDLIKLCGESFLPGLKLLLEL